MKTVTRGSLLQTLSQPVCRQVPGAAGFRICLRQPLPPRTLGFCSNDCLILRSFKHVKTVDSGAVHLSNDHLNATTGIYHKYRERVSP